MRTIAGHGRDVRRRVRQICQNKRAEPRHCFASDLLSDHRLVFLFLAALSLYALRRGTTAEDLSAFLCLYLERVQSSVHDLRAEANLNLSVL